MVIWRSLHAYYFFLVAESFYIYKKAIFWHLFLFFSLEGWGENNPNEIYMEFVWVVKSNRLPMGR